MLKNVRIATKLLAGFLVIAAMSTAMGAYAALNLKQVGKDSKIMYDNMLMKNSSHWCTWKKGRSTI